MLKSRFVLTGLVVGALAVAGGGAYLTGALTGGKGPADAAAAQGPGGGAQQGPPPAPVRIAEAVSASLAPLSEAPGSVVSLRDSLVAAATAGKITWIANVGDEVEEGGVIARIDAADAKTARDEAAAEVARLASRAGYLERNYDRFVGLGDESGESEASLDQMRADRDEAAQSLSRARASLERAEVNLQRTEVRAPFGGRIVSQEIQIGEYAGPGAPIARLVDTHHLEVTAQAPAPLLASVKAGDEIRVTDGQKTIVAPIRAIVPVGNQISRTLELRLALPEPIWHIGSAVRVNLPTRAPEEVTAAHRDALVLRANRVSVFVVSDDMKAKQVDVELGAADGDLIEVIGDVTPGDRLVIRGGERLRDGQTVSIQEAVASGDAAATNLY